jgi:hypothetical protein
MPDDDDSGGCISLTVSLGAIEGHDDRDDDGFPINWYEFTWLTPQRLVAIATDLNAADERGDDVRPVLQSWQESRTRRPAAPRGRRHMTRGNTVARGYGVPCCRITHVNFDVP